MPQQAVIVIGAGDATGSAIARRFARDGFVACVARRSAEALAPLIAEITAAGGQARAFGLDARDPQAVADLFATVEGEIAPVGAAVFNAGAFLSKPTLETTPDEVHAAFMTNCLAGFVMAREAGARMVPRGAGTILFTGATASLRGGKNFAAFAAAKFGLRAIAQSFARDLGPKGIHVAHVIVDGMIDTAVWRARAPEIVAAKGPDGLLAPEAIAEAYWMLHAQPRSAWTFELDLRPFSEAW